VKLANKLFLSGVLSLSAGVMLFVSMIEIFVKSNVGFSDYGYAEGKAYLYATLCFFLGIAIYEFLDLLVHFISKGDSNEIAVADDHAMMEMTVQIAENKEKENDTNEESEASNDLKEQKPSLKMGIMVAIAIGIHNFPEGLATFVATLADKAVGAALAVAIGIHNIPEGLCVAIPVFYATGNRWKAFLWAMLCGITEPIGAGLGWLVLKDHFDDRLYGVIFGIVSGLMVAICLKELIPTAHKYDPNDKVATKCLIFGMMVMATSLVLFVY